MNQVVVSGVVAEATRFNEVLEATVVARGEEGGFFKTRVKAFGKVAEALALQAGRPYLFLGSLYPRKKGEQVQPEVAVYRAVPLQGTVEVDEKGPFLVGGANRVLLSGYLGQDAQVKAVQFGEEEGDLLTLATVAVRTLRGETLWVPLRAWGEEIASTLGEGKKGDYVVLEGSYTLHRYEKDGKTFFTPQVRVRKVYALGRKEGGEEPDVEDLF